MLKQSIDSISLNSRMLTPLGSDDNINIKTDKKSCIFGTLFI